MLDKVQVGDATLYHGDCLEVLESIERVHCVVTDPPYGIDYQSARRIDSERFPKIANDADLSFMPALLGLIHTATVADAHAYVFCRWDKWGAIDWAPWMPKNMLVWDKGQHGTGDLEGAYGLQHELCAFLAKGRRKLLGTRPVDVIRYQKVQAMALQHPNEKPVGLLERLLATSSNMGEAVLDPFMGSGSTGVACARMGRRFIGVEIDRLYFDLACERIDQAQRQPRLFDDLDVHAPGLRQSDFGI